MWDAQGLVRPNYLPRGHMRPFHYAFELELFRLYVLALHRRYSKSRGFFNAAGAKCRDKGWGVWHTFPTFAQGRDVFWNATDEHGVRMLDDLLPYTSEVNDQRMILKFGKGGFYQVMGTDKLNKRVGGGPKCIGYDEFSLQNPMARNYYAPMLKANNGVEAFMFTFRGENHAAGVADYAKAYPEEAFYLELNMEQTVRDAPGEDRFGEPVITQADLDMERRLFAASGGRLGMSESMIQQEFYNSREGVNQDQVYGMELAALRKLGDRITHVPHDPALLVHTAWDRGVHNRVGFYQKKGRALYCIDYLSTDNSSPMQIAALLREGHRSLYQYGLHFVGRDAEDPTAWQWHEKSSLEIWAGLGIKFEIAPFLRVQTGIDAVKAMLPRCWFDAKRCEQWLNDLRDYRWAVNPVFQTMSEPDKRQMSRHTADMTRVMAVTETDEFTRLAGETPPAAPASWVSV